MSTRSLYDLTNDEIYSQAKNHAAGSTASFKSYVQNLIDAQGEKFLENTISSTYLLLNTDNYQALLDSYSRQLTQMSRNRAAAASVRARLADATTSAEWKQESSTAGAQALAAFAVGVPAAALALDRGASGVAYALAGATVVAAAALYASSAVRTHRDPKKRYWAKPGTAGANGGVGL